MLLIRTIPQSACSADSPLYTRGPLDCAPIKHLAKPEFEEKACALNMCYVNWINEKERRLSRGTTALYAVW